jgi:hypothetical protein
MWDATAVRTIPAPLRPRPGGRAPSPVAELAVAALTVVSGLQLLRLMVATVAGVALVRLALMGDLNAEPGSAEMARRAHLAVGLAGPADRLHLALGRSEGDRLRRHHRHGQRPLRHRGHRALERRARIRRRMQRQAIRAARDRCAPPTATKQSPRTRMRDRCSRPGHPRAGRPRPGWRRAGGGSPSGSPAPWPAGPRRRRRQRSRRPGRSGRWRRAGSRPPGPRPR